MASKTISLVVEYKNGKLVARELEKTAEAAGKVEKNVDRGEIALGKLKVAAVAAGAALVAAASYSLKEWMKAENAVTQLEGSMRALGIYTVQSSKKFQDLASSLQRVSRYGDDELLPMFSKLMTLGNVSADSMERVMKAAMDFAVITGSLESAVDLLAKASVGYTATLSRYGIILDESIPKNEKFEAVLKLIESRMGGLEKAMSETTEGSITRMKNAIGDLAEEFGKYLAPGVEAGADALRKFAEKLRDAIKAQDEWYEKRGINRAGLSKFGQFGPQGLIIGGGSPLSSNLAPDMVDRTGAFTFNGNTIPVPRGGDGGGPTILSSFLGTAGNFGLRGFPAATKPLSGGELLRQMPTMAPMPTGFESMLQEPAESAETLAMLDAFAAKQQRIADLGGLMGNTVASAFANMASGAQSAGDAMSAALLGALGQLAMMYGQFLIAAGLGIGSLPGGQKSLAAVVQGVALMALGGTLQGLAGSIGGGGRRSSGVGGYGGGGTPYSMGANGGSPTIIIVSANGRASEGGRDVGRALDGAGVSFMQKQQIRQFIVDQNRSGTNVSQLR